MRSIRIIATVCAALLLDASALQSTLPTTPFAGLRASDGHAESTQTRIRASAARMVAIPAGRYTPLYATIGNNGIDVAAFSIDEIPVTRAAFVLFVSQRTEWRRSRVDPARAKRQSYLRSWSGDLDAGDSSDMQRPVTDVSWYAASAYCQSLGKRLPSQAEWEYVAAASATQRDASRDPGRIQQLVGLYSLRSSIPAPVSGAAKNVYGVSGLHDRVWEWVADANAAIAAINHAEHLKGAHQPGTEAQHDMSCAGSALGAADPRNYPAFLRYSLRSTLGATSAMSSLGFRCAT